MTRAELALPLELGEQEPAPQEAGLVINITGEGEIIVADQSFDLGGLENLVREEIQLHSDRPPQELKLLIRADKNADSARLNQVVRLLQSLDVGSARLATEVPR
jgi:biopolymer transport protein ExbD